jgi:ADP-heptose:LPS heptosyltransferase
MPTPQAIFIAHITGITESVLAVPALRSLRRHLPDASITIAASSEGTDILRLGRLADEILSLERLARGFFLPHRLYLTVQTARMLRGRAFDIAIDFGRNFESSLAIRLVSAPPLEEESPRALDKLKRIISNRSPEKLHMAHEFLQRLEPLGVRPVEAEPRLFTNAEADQRFEKLLAKHRVGSGELLVGIHAGAGRGKDRWPAERFASMASRMIHNFDARALIFAGPEERGLAKKIAKQVGSKRVIVLESPSLEDFVSASARMSLFIANHSGPAHVAAAAGAPVVTASGALTPLTRDILSPNRAHIRATALSAVSEEDVFEAACRLMKRSRSAAYGIFS